MRNMEDVIMNIKFILILIIWQLMASTVYAVAEGMRPWTNSEISIRAKADKIIYRRAVREAKDALEGHFQGVERKRTRIRVRYEPFMYKRALAVCEFGLLMGQLSNTIILFVGRSDMTSPNGWVLVLIHEMLHCYYGFGHLEGTILHPTNQYDDLFLALSPTYTSLIEEIEMHYTRGTLEILDYDSWEYRKPDPEGKRKDFRYIYRQYGR